jgi:hypothetical protein
MSDPDARIIEGFTPKMLADMLAAARREAREAERDRIWAGLKAIRRDDAAAMTVVFAK